MDNFNITDDTNFWIYVTTAKLWKDLEYHFENNIDMYISTYKYSYVSNGDIIVIYSKDKTSPSKTGFVCVVQVKSDQIDNLSGKINIYSDKNLNKYCFHVETCVFLPKLVKIDDIVPYITVDSFKSKKSFTGKYLRYDSVFNKIDQDLGNNIVNSFFELTPDSISFEDNQRSEFIDESSDDVSHINIENDTSIDDQIENFDDDTNNCNRDPKDSRLAKSPERNLGNPDHQKDSGNKSRKKSKGGMKKDEPKCNEDNNINNEQLGNIPVMIVLCKKSLNELISEPDNEPNILYNHLLNCNICDVTDNDNIRIKLLNLWKDSDILYLETDSEKDEYNSALNAYHNLKNHNPFGDIDKPTIRLLNIIEEGNIYNNCMLIESYFPIIKTKDSKPQKTKVLVKAKKNKKN